LKRQVSISQVVSECFLAADWRIKGYAPS